jgi:hypothetical protein
MTIGRGIRLARQEHRDPFQALIKLLKTTPYPFGTIIFEGKVIDVFRRTTAGFAKGRAILESTADYRQQMEIVFQNEHLIARANGKLKAIVPDLICVLDSETAEPITTEAIKYGQRVKVMAVSVPELMRTPEALAVFGPRAFGLDEEFCPIEQLVDREE